MSSSQPTLPPLILFIYKHLPSTPDPAENKTSPANKPPIRLLELSVALLIRGFAAVPCRSYISPLPPTSRRAPCSTLAQLKRAIAESQLHKPSSPHSSAPSPRWPPCSSQARSPAPTPRDHPRPRARLPARTSSRPAAPSNRYSRSRHPGQTSRALPRRADFRAQAQDLRLLAPRLPSTCAGRSLDSLGRRCERPLRRLPRADSTSDDEMLTM